jgi:hypothetical protein
VYQACIRDALGLYEGCIRGTLGVYWGSHLGLMHGDDVTRGRGVDRSPPGSEVGVVPHPPPGAYIRILPSST